MHRAFFILFIFLLLSQVSAQLKFNAVFRQANQSVVSGGFQNTMRLNPPQVGGDAQTGGAHKTPLWVEAGYILAMQTFFAGMGYLASRDSKWGPASVGIIDLFFVFAGIGNALGHPAHQAGYYLLSAGFLAKALYNFKFNSMHQTRGRFWTNYIGFNVLVFSGYYLDSLK